MKNNFFFIIALIITLSLTISSFLFPENYEISSTDFTYIRKSKFDLIVLDNSLVENNFFQFQKTNIANEVNTKKSLPNVKPIKENVIIRDSPKEALNISYPPFKFLGYHQNNDGTFLFFLSLDDENILVKQDDVILGRWKILKTSNEYIQILDIDTNSFFKLKL